MEFIKTEVKRGQVLKNQSKQKGSGLEKSDLSVAPFSNNLADGRIKMACSFFPVITSSAVQSTNISLITYLTFSISLLVMRPNFLTSRLLSTVLIWSRTIQPFLL